MNEPKIEPKIQITHGAAEAIEYYHVRHCACGQEVFHDGPRDRCQCRDMVEWQCADCRPYVYEDLLLREVRAVGLAGSGLAGRWNVVGLAGLMLAGVVIFLGGVGVGWWLTR